MLVNFEKLRFGSAVVLIRLFLVSGFVVKLHFSPCVFVCAACVQPWFSPVKQRQVLVKFEQLLLGSAVVLICLFLVSCV